MSQGKAAGPGMMTLGEAGVNLTERVAATERALALRY